MVYGVFLVHSATPRGGTHVLRSCRREVGFCVWPHYVIQTSCIVACCTFVSRTPHSFCPSTPTNSAERHRMRVGGQLLKEAMAHPHLIPRIRTTPFMTRLRLLTHGHRTTNAGSSSEPSLVQPQCFSPIMHYYCTVSLLRVEVGDSVRHRFPQLVPRCFSCMSLVFSFFALLCFVAPGISPHPVAASSYFIFIEFFYVFTYIQLCSPALIYAVLCNAFFFL
uniref:Uncharacterized protein n=1 Tax=Trypanosoma vivax (strain Y486) TaxID=1055687 RepID=G0TWJ5_TRYVY|nr:hypothetical protein TVY486_0601240 [Trypanosoma vivax Y486]